MICFGTDDEHWQANGGQIHRPSLGLEFAARQGVVEIKLAQVFRMHAARHSCAVGVPCHQIVRCFTLAAQVRIDGGRPQQIAGAQQREGASHLLTLEHAAAIHDRLQHVELAWADENRQLARLAEVLLRREQRDACQSLIAFGGEGGRGDREQGAADTIAHRMDLAIGHDARYRIDAGLDAEPQVVIHTKPAVAGVRILP